MPMIGRGDRDGINIFVLEEPANIDVGFWLWQAQLLDVAKALVQHVFIHIAERGNLRPWNTGKPMEVIIAATSYSANCHSDAVIRAHDSCVAGCRDAQRSAGHASASDFQKVPPRSSLFRHTTSIECNEKCADQGPWRGAPLRAV